MNVQLANAISDISGVTGQAILRAIVAGKRDPWELAKLRDRRIVASKEEIAHSLQGNWREDVIFELQSSGRVLRFLPEANGGLRPGTEEIYYGSAQPARLSKSMICRKMLPHCPPQNLHADRKPNGKANSDLTWQRNYRRTIGVDLTRIDGIDVITAQVIFSEIGPNFSAFPDENHFASWLTLAPQRNISGGKVIRHIPAAGRQRVATHYAWPPNRSRAATPISGLAIVGYGCGSMDLKQSKRWPAISLAWFIAWLPRGRLI